jgi:hypothetical protein
MAHRILRTESDRENYVRFVQNASLPRTFEDTPGADRTRDQNALQWLWATEAANQLGDRTPGELQRDWKLRHGVPILREDSAEFRDIYDRLIKPLSYEHKIEAMRFIDVTSDMKVKQMVRFLDAVQRECLEQGLRITDPDPDLAAYQKRYRTKEAA